MESNSRLFLLLQMGGEMRCCCGWNGFMESFVLDIYDVEKDSVDKGCASRCVQKFLEQFSQMG